MTKNTTSARVDELFELARRVGELGEKKAEASENLQDLDPEVMGALKESGLFKVLRPRLFGGYELDPWTYVELVREVSRFDLSTGWVYSVLEIHEWWMAYAHPGFQEEVWGGEEKVVVDSIAPMGRAERVNGKWRVEGRWRFVSGVSHADFCAVNALAVFEEGGQPEPAFFIIPKGEYRIERDWRVVGLQGTGSHAVVVEGALVPEHRVLRLMPLAKGGVPLNPRLQESPLYRTQFIPMLATAIYAPMLGAAQKALEIFQKWVEGRVRPYALGAKEREAPGSQRLLAEMSVLYDAAHALSERHTREIYELGKAKRSQDEPLLRARFFAQRAWMAQAALEVVERLFRASGGNALYLDHPMQRVWRDAHAAAAHVAVVYEDALASLGREMMGLPGHPLI